MVDKCEALGILQVKVDGQDTEEEDLRFEILPGRIRCAMPGAAHS